MVIHSHGMHGARAGEATPYPQVCLAMGAILPREGAATGMRNKADNDIQGIALPPLERTAGTGLYFTSFANKPIDPDQSSAFLFEPNRFWREGF